MERIDIIKTLKAYFDIRELVCPHTYNRFKDLSWQFLETELLFTILILRTKIIGRPMVINNWHYGGTFDERGFRCNLCSISKKKTLDNEIYLSAHCNGAAVDFTTNNPAEKDRKIIEGNASPLPVPVRLEKGVSWVHIDIYDPCLNENKVNFFSA